jgi:hypothetical protein
MRYRTRVTGPAALLGVGAALSVAARAHAGPETAGPGPETLGDPVFPGLGNDGYRVSAYHLDLAYKDRQGPHGLPLRDVVPPPGPPPWSPPSPSPRTW